MIRKRTLLRTLTAAITLAAAPHAPAQANTAVPAVQAGSASRTAGPALWRVSDGDTTIYLFGTVHALPPSLDWYDGQIGAALASSEELVTEIPRGAVDDPAAQQAIGMRAVLAPGQTMRAMLTPKQRAIYEEALAKLDLSPDIFDRFEPWFAAMTLASLPLMQQGYASHTGVEKVIESKAGDAKVRGALETVEGQIDMFDTLPLKSQIAFLVTTAANIDNIVPQMDAMVAEWVQGDADQLARLMNQGLGDKVLANRLLYARNRMWADWIKARMARPGTVFMAVGAGHLAGGQSVQDALRRRGFKVTRVQ